MNLTSMLQDDSLTNLTWLRDPKTYQPSDKDIDQKDDLAIEWGRGDVSSLDRPTSTINNQMEVKHSILEKETLLDYVQVLLHQGITKEEAMTQAALRFPSETIEAASEELKSVLKTEGIVGSVVIDLSKTKSPAKIIKAAMKSPYRKYIAYVMMTPDQITSSSLVKTSKISGNTSMKKGSIDGFFSGDEKAAVGKPMYAPLNLPVIISRAELDPEFYDSTLIDLVNTSGLTETEAKDIYRADGDEWMKLRKAFRIANRRRTARTAPSMAAENQAADYRMEASMDVQIDAAPITALEVDGSTPRHNAGSFEMTQKKAKKEMSVFMFTGPVTDVQVDDNSEKASPQLDIDEMEVRQDVPIDDISYDVDVSMDLLPDEEFIGGDEFALDDIIQQKPLDISPEAEIEV